MKKIAVFFGGRSCEHDVSILTGLQVCTVMDVTKYEPLPVYVNKVGRLFVGPQLLDPKFYPVLEFRESQLTEVVIPVGETYPCLQCRFGLFKKKIPFDIAFLAFHGAEGESGGFQGVFQTAGIPYTGADLKSSAVYMDKVLTKLICRSLGIKVLPDHLIPRPRNDFYDAKQLLANFPLAFPVIAKPRSLGSSVGIRLVRNTEELELSAVDIFKLGDDVLCEPFVENLTEYNIALVRGQNGEIMTSAIERPNASGEILSFADKYLGNGCTKSKKKFMSIMPSKELVESRREFNPNISEAQREFIVGSAVKLFKAMGSSGAPRIDFLSNKASGEIWLNEVNPIPGSFAFYLWAQAAKPLDFQELVGVILSHANFAVRDIDLKQSSSMVFK
ncbi:MAG: hypothetical protein LBB08_00315 [Rickettsiales bacterium]|jgi:D-alanine-D-alanine ligase|nr:hypothetical protein [Rickettsiales bacterium]